MTRAPYKSRPTPGSVADLVLAYRKSPRVLAWAPATFRAADQGAELLGGAKPSNVTRMKR